MDKVGAMLKDHTHTQFVVVCIAEYLSVMESERLMGELTEQGVRSGVVICNQLLPLIDVRAVRDEANEAVHGR